MKSSTLAVNTSTTSHSEAAKYLHYHRLLEEHGITNFQLDFMPADCSPRQYIRAKTPQSSFIIMDASREKHSVPPFIYMDKVLKTLGLKVPKIYVEDTENGMLLLEDFGNTTLTKHLAAHPGDEQALYNETLSFLKTLYNADVSKLSLPTYSRELYMRELQVFCDWYLKHKVAANMVEAAEHELKVIVSSMLDELESAQQVLTLRDYMADNMMVTNEGGELKIGLLDFQDAVLGNPAYDIVCLLEDARRDVSPEVVSNIKSRFITELKLDKSTFERHYAILGLQKNLKIVGIFHRRNVRDNQPKYLDFLPRIWDAIEHALQKDVGQPLKNWFSKYDAFDK